MTSLEPTFLVGYNKLASRRQALRKCSAPGGPFAVARPWPVLSPPEDRPPHFPTLDKGRPWPLKLWMWKDQILCRSRTEVAPG
jgi:hypothetical protein